MSEELKPFEVSDYLNTESQILAYLNVALEDSDPVMLQIALGNIARSKGMAKIAKAAGVGRESLYKSLSEEGNPSFQTIAKVVAAIGGKITITKAA